MTIHTKLGFLQWLQSMQTSQKLPFLLYAIRPAMKNIYIKKMLLCQKKLGEITECYV